MINIKKLRRIMPIIIIVAASLFLSSCGAKDSAADPGEWGYDCSVLIMP
ncbi:MAG: hypothetical protein PHC56_10495 [Herbinix sp.]|nr:hypothetical protein [Herbinix sp.]